MEETTKYEVRVLATSWQGMECAAKRTLADPLTPEQRNATDELPAVQAAARAQLGDFSSVTAWDVVKVVRTTDTETWSAGGERGPRRVIEQSETWHHTLVAFTDDEQDTWHDAMYPEYDEVDA